MIYCRALDCSNGLWLIFANNAINTLMIFPTSFFQFSVNQNGTEGDSLKLGYNEVPPCSDAAAAAWSEILENGNEPVDMKILLELVKAGTYIVKIVFWSVKAPVPIGQPDP